MSTNHAHGQGFMKALKCRECGREYPLTATHVCEFDFGPLEVAYDYARIKGSLTREAIASRPQSMWRYRELLPVAGEPTVGRQVGYTPLVRAERLARRLGIRELWIKNDAVNYPTLSFKDRVVSVALSRARELGFKTVACASTGNLANSVAANAAASGTMDGKAVYEKYCVACHGAGVAGAPKFGDKAAWAPRLKQGQEVLYTHALKGFKAMPPKGGAADLPDAQIKATVDYLSAAGK